MYVFMCLCYSVPYVGIGIVYEFQQKRYPSSYNSPKILDHCRSKIILSERMSFRMTSKIRKILA